MNCDLFNFSGQGSGNNSLENMIFYTKRQIALGLKMHPIALEAPFCYILKLMSIPYVEDSHQLIFEAIVNFWRNLTYW